MTTLTFNDIKLNPVSQTDNQIWLGATQLGLALNYANPETAVTKIYNRKADEFNSSMTKLVELKTNGGIQKIRIFSLRGCHLIAMFARTEIAKKFRIWVLDILDKEVGEAVIKTTTKDDRTPLRQAVNALIGKSNLAYDEAYRMVHQFMGVTHIDEIAFNDLQKAIAYVHNLTLTVSGQKSEIINTNPNAPYAEKFRVVGREANDDSRRRLNFVAKQLDEAQRQMRALLALNGLTYDCFVEVNSGFVMTPEQRQQGREQAKEMLESYVNKGLISKTSI